MKNKKTTTKLEKRKEIKPVNLVKKNSPDNNLNKKYVISTTIILLLFSIMLIVFCQNITLKIDRNKLNEYLEEYKELKSEIDHLTEIKENDNIIVENNNNHSAKKTELENKIAEINKNIANMNAKIDKLK